MYLEDYDYTPYRVVIHGHSALYINLAIFSFAYWILNALSSLVWIHLCSHNHMYNIKSAQQKNLKNVFWPWRHTHTRTHKSCILEHHMEQKQSPFPLFAYCVEEVGCSRSVLLIESLRIGSVWVLQNSKSIDYPVGLSSKYSHYCESNSTGSMRCYSGPSLV